MPDDEPKPVGVEDLPKEPLNIAKDPAQSGFKVSTAPPDPAAGVTITAKAESPPMPTMQLSTDKPDDDAGLSSNVPPKPQSPASEDTPVESAVEKKKDDKKDENDDDGKVEQKDDPYKAKFKDIETVPKGDTDAAKLKDAVMKTNSNLSAVVHNFREAYKEIKDSPDSLKDQVKDSFQLTEGAQGLVDKVKEGFDKVKNLLSPRPSGPSQDASSDEKEKKDAEVSPAKQTPGPGESISKDDPKVSPDIAQKFDAASVGADKETLSASALDKDGPTSTANPSPTIMKDQATADKTIPTPKVDGTPQPTPPLPDANASKGLKM